MGQKVIRPIGANPTKVDSAAAFTLGETLETADGKEFIYVQANGALTGAGYVAVIDQSTFKATELTTANGANKYGWPVGIETAVVPDQSYCWLQVRGAVSVECAAAVAAGTRVNSTATSGAIDDDATVGARPIEGMSLTTAAAAAGLAAAALMYPKIGITL